MVIIFFIGSTQRYLKTCKNYWHDDHDIGSVSPHDMNMHLVWPPWSSVLGMINWSFLRPQMAPGFPFCSYFLTPTKGQNLWEGQCKEKQSHNPRALPCSDLPIGSFLLLFTNMEVLSVYFIQYHKSHIKICITNIKVFMWGVLISIKLK